MLRLVLVLAAPWQNAPLPLITAVGRGVAVITTWAEFVQPKVLVAVAVYVVVAPGDAITEAPEVVFSPAAGPHVKFVGVVEPKLKFMIGLNVAVVPVVAANPVVVPT
jgi:hypothetical protein